MKANIYLAVAAAFVAASCATATQVEAQLKPRAPEPATLRNISVLGFSGNYGDTFTRQLTALLQGATDAGKPYFNIANTENLLSRSGVRSFRGGSDDVAAALSFGRENRLDAVYFGRTDGTVSNTRYTERRTQCIKVGDKSCGEQREYTVSCTRVDAAFSAYPQIVNVASGIVVYAKTVAQSARESYCSDRVRQNSDAGLLGQAAAAAALEIRRDVAPYTRTLNVNLKRDSSSLKGADKEQFTSAVAFATAGRMDRACGVWEAMRAGSPDNVEVLYNLGVCAETSGDFDRALELYTRADGKLTRPDTMISSALVRARALKEGRDPTSR